MISNFLSENATGLVLLLLRLGSSLALYAFLAFAVRTIWQELRQQTDSAALQAVPPIYLKPEGCTESSAFTLNEITIGRSPNCDVCTPDETVSAVHTRLYYRSKQWWVEDNQSSNGTLLNGLPVNTPTVLTSGDLLKLGSFSVSVTFPQ